MYSSRDIQEVYEKLEIKTGQTIFLTSGLAHLFEFEAPGKDVVLAAHLQALENAVGLSGTIVSPAASLYLCNTEIPFNLELTASSGVGALSEYIRLQKGSYRSFHPFVSFVARGANAQELVEECSRYAFGVGSPMDRMLERDATCISIGKQPGVTATVVHHVEQRMSVPYRYTKEFLHPVVRNGTIVREPFYMYVCYRCSDIMRSCNRRIFSLPQVENLVKSTDLGRGKVFSFSMREFQKEVSNAMLEDPYIWCERPPIKRPWQE